jgi:hypothetical protein
MRLRTRSEKRHLPGFGVNASRTGPFRRGGKPLRKMAQTSEKPLYSVVQYVVVFLVALA